MWKLKAQAAAIRKRLDDLIDERGQGRVIVMGDFNDGRSLTWTRSSSSPVVEASASSRPC